MKIRLINFMCYSDSVFEFSENGLVLISGPSGCGKTSILRGIFFALFGEGNKLQTYGKTSSTVELEFEDVKIIRKKRPNHLLLNDIYEDEAAQEIINKKFGATFKVSGYIQQNYQCSFILMSPLEKLSFLEKFAFQDVDLGEIKEKCKIQISKTHDNLTEISTQLKINKNTLENLNLPEKINFPIPHKKLDHSAAIKNVQIKLKNARIIAIKTERIKEQIMRELNDLKIFINVQDNTKSSIDFINTKLTKLKTEEQSIHFIGATELSKLEKELKNIIKKRELSQLELRYKQNTKKLKEMTNSEQEKLLSEIQHLEQNLWKEYTPDELSTTMSDLKICLNDVENIEKLLLELCDYQIDRETIEKNKEKLVTINTKLDQYQITSLKLIAQQQSYTCPNCDVSLNLIDQKLILTEETDKNEESYLNIEEVKKEMGLLKQSSHKFQKLISEQENKLSVKNKILSKIESYTNKYTDCPSCNDLKKDINYLQKYEISQNQLEKRKKEKKICLDNQTFSASYSSFKQDTNTMLQDLTKLRGESGDVCDMRDEEEVRIIILTQTAYKNKLQFIKSSQDDLLEEMTRYETILREQMKNFKDSYGDIKEQMLLNNNLEKIIIEIDETRKTILNYEKQLELVTKWEDYEKQLQKYNEWKDKISMLEKEEIEGRNMYAAALSLKEKIAEAESLAMVNIIDSINTHARWYLDCFFVDNPIAVQLQTFKETKKSTKPCINVEIEYKGMECDLHMLSGGELSRIVLAYTLALSEMFNTPLLLLDECTANLDQDLTNIVCDGIRENFKGKLVLIIAHQVVSGTFDKVITLK